MCVDMYGALPMHEGAECKNKESYVGAATSFVDVKSSDVFVVVDVVRDERCSYEDVENVVVCGG